MVASSVDLNTIQSMTCSNMLATKMGVESAVWTLGCIWELEADAVSAPVNHMLLAAVAGVTPGMVTMARPKGGQSSRRCRGLLTLARLWPRGYNGPIHAAEDQHEDAIHPDRLPLPAGRRGL